MVHLCCHPVVCGMVRSRLSPAEVLQPAVTALQQADARILMVRLLLSACHRRHYPPALGCMQLAYDERSVAGSSRRSTGAAVAAAGDGSKAVGSSAASTKKQAGAIPHKVVLLHG